MSRASAPQEADRSMVDRVHEGIRERIMSGEYGPGTRLTLPRLAEEHGISPIPIREALRLLEAERLVVIEPNRGATVAPISVADIRDIYATRIVLERHALMRAYAALGGAVSERAETELEAMAAAFAAGDERRAYEHHQRFHFALYESGSSPWTLHLISQLWMNAERYVRQAAAARRSPSEFVAEHEAILSALRDGRVEAAADLLEANLATTARLLADHYDTSDRDIRSDR